MIFIINTILPIYYLNHVIFITNTILSIYYLNYIISSQSQKLQTNFRHLGGFKS